MSYKVSKLRRAALFGSAATLLTSFALGAGVTGVSAQSTDSDDEVEEVVVTGSRIRRPDLQSSSPVQVIGNFDLKIAGTVNIETQLNELPSVTPDQTTTTNNGGTGIATVNLRDLNAERTLVLVNGRRFVGSNTAGLVDLNNIPAPLIQRVDVVTGGQSAVYGSDAVAGVVNFILKDDFEGVEFSGQYGIAERGFGDTRTASVTIGSNLADGRGNVTAHASFTDRQAVLSGERAFSRDALFDIGNGELQALGSSRIVGAFLGRATQADGSRGLFLPDGSFIADDATFDANGAPIARNGETFNFQPDNFLQTPQERFLFTAIGNYDITDNIRYTFEGTYSNNRVDQQLAFDANDIPDGGPLFVPATNPLIPQDTLNFLLQNFDQGRDGDAVAGDGIATLPDVRRRLVEVGPRFEGRNFDLFRLVNAIEGDINENWNFDASYSYGRVNRSFVSLRRTSDLLIQQALNATTDANGNPVCTNPSGGCVPINIFGRGIISEDAATFIAPEASTTTFNEQNIFASNVSGIVEGFDLGAGPLGLAFGVEYREETSEFNPDRLSQTGELGPGTASQPTRGEFDVFEFYGEAILPLLADAPFAKQLDIELAARVSDYSTVGGVFSWKGGLQWAPVEDIRFRAAYQRAVRAPNIGELFDGPAIGAQSTIDPCSAENIAGQPQNVLDFCEATGVVLGEFSADIQTITESGGNPNLFEETADTYTIGAVITPQAIPGLSVTVDYYNITVEDAISTLAPTTVLDLCFDNPGNDNEFCGLIQRQAGGQIIRLSTPTFNIGQEDREGIDWAINYNFDAFGGSVTLNQAGNYTFTNESVPVPGQAAVDCNGLFGGACIDLGDFVSPEWRINNNVTYARDAWAIRATGRVIGGLDNTVPDTAVPSVSENFYLDVGFTYQVNDNFELVGGVDNVTDNTPPLLGFSFGPDANTDPSLFDVLGRSYFMRANVKF